MSPSLERALERGLRVSALSALMALSLLTVFIVREGLPLILKISPQSFLLSSTWRPGQGLFGVLPMLVGTALVTGLALLIGVPIAMACAIVLSELAPPQVRAVLKPLIELLASIPSVVYGFLGLVAVVPLVRTWLGGPGTSVLAAALVLSVMILPTVAAVATDALLAVPSSYREGALALGATGWQATSRVVLPAARRGLIAAIILGTGRAIGETMAVIMVAGNAVQVPHSLLDPARTLTAHIALEMSYATGDHARALFATGVVLFALVMGLNVAVIRLGGRRSRPTERRRWWRRLAARLALLREQGS